MLDEAVVDKERYEAQKKARTIITGLLNGESGYDYLDAPLGEEDLGAERPESAWEADPEGVDLGPPQEATIPLDAPNPFPMLDAPVEF